MKWQKIEDRSKARDYLPKDKPFLAFWKGVICLCQFDEDEDQFYIGFLPTEYTGFFKVAKEREGKFTHWIELELPEDY